MLLVLCCVLAHMLYLAHCEPTIGQDASGTMVIQSPAGISINASGGVSISSTNEKFVVYF